MPISTKTKTSLLTPDFKNQIASNGKLSDETEENKITDIKNNYNQALLQPKGKYNDVANLHFSRGKKAEFRAFFSAHEVTLVQGVENAVNYIMKEVKAGRLSISRNGIEKIGE